jgi:hypothetical protein
MSLNAATAAPSGHFLVSRKNPSVSAQTHLISVSLEQALTYMIKIQNSKGETDYHGYPTSAANLLGYFIQL